MNKKFWLYLIYIWIGFLYGGTSNDSYYLNDSLKTKSLKSESDSLKLKKADTLKVYEIRGFISALTQTISKKDYQRKDYRTPADYISETSYGFKKDFGVFGQPNELNIFGFGNSNIEYLHNGIPINNRMANVFNLNNIQTEYIDSVEIVSLSRSFIYGNFNNPVAVNFVTRNKIESVPKTRLRFLQGPDEEGYIDAYFNAYVMNKVSFTFEFTNSSIDSSRANDSYGSWQGSAKLHYLFSNKINFIGGFRYSNSETRYNGGLNKELIDADKVDMFNADLDASYVKFRNTYYKNRRYEYEIRTLLDLFPNQTTEVSFYYHSNKDEIRQNEYSSELINNVLPINKNNETYTGGIYFRQPLNFNAFKLDLISRYENTKYKFGTINQNDNLSSFSLAGVASINFSNNIELSSFAKYLIVDDLSFYGFGGEINIPILNNLIINSGVSVSEKPYNLFEKTMLDELSKKNQNLLFEANLIFSENNFNTRFGVFLSSRSNAAIPYLENTDSTFTQFISNYKLEDYSTFGVQTAINYFYKFIEFEFAGTYYGEQNSKKVLPEYVINFGVYYKDKLFKNNLDLKAGFRGLLTGRQSNYIYDFTQSRASFFTSNDIAEYGFDSYIDEYFKLDFLVSAEIQERAIFYLVFENIIPNEFYAVPYYPIKNNILRIGLSWEFYN